MKHLITAALILVIGFAAYSEESKKYSKYVDELRNIVVKKDVKKLADHLSPDGIEMIATVNPEIWTKEKVAGFLNSKDPNSIKDIFFNVLPSELKEKKIEVYEDESKDGFELNSDLKGSGIHIKIKLKGDTWIITGFGYLG